MEKSIWLDNTELPSFDALNGEDKTDVLIVGGGICGLLCACFLKRAGVDCAVVESGRIASGVSGKTTAKITALHGLIYADMIEKNGIEKARKYFDINERAIDEFRKMSRRIDCDFEELSSFVYSMDSKEKIEREFAALQKLSANTSLRFESSLPFSIAATVGIDNQAQFNPIKFIKAISLDLKIYENTRVKEITHNCAICDRGQIKAEKFIIATHFPFINKHGLYFMKLYQNRSYVLAIEGAKKVDGMYVDEAQRELSFRSYGNYLILGGGSSRTGKTCNGWKELERVKEEYYPNSEIRYKWATQDCMSLDKIPYIGKYSKNTENVYVATGFNKWGMTSSMVSAIILTDLVNGIKNEYADVFSPSRSILKPQLFVNGFETLANFIYPTTRRCPHLGCALKWNKYERTWDCPCHGSRFEEDGKLINNPANRDFE